MGSVCSMGFLNSFSSFNSAGSVNYVGSLGLKGYVVNWNTSKGNQAPTLFDGART